MRTTLFLLLLLTSSALAQTNTNYVLGSTLPTDPHTEAWWWLAGLCSGIVMGGTAFIFKLVRQIGKSGYEF